MPYCQDCLRSGEMLPMIAQGEEVYKGKTYIILVCTIGCGSSIRVPKTVKEVNQHE